MGRKKKEEATLPLNTAGDNTPADNTGNVQGAEGDAAKATRATQERERGVLCVMSCSTSGEDVSTDSFAKLAEVEDNRAGMSWIKENGKPGNTYCFARVYPKRYAVKQVTTTEVVK